MLGKNFIGLYQENEMNSQKYKLGLLKIPVTDIERSAQFYKQSLGFKLTFQAPEYGWAQFQAGELELALYIPGKGGGERIIGGNVDFHLVLDGDDFDQLAPALKGASFLVEDMIHTGNDGSTFIDIRDPDENIIKVFRRR
jgi:catechol 2,3-dioxygenase-like lactoylglutathione lyase family enzyme